MADLQQNSRAQAGLVLITGCSSGIGQALVQEFLRAGFPVMATARKLEGLAVLAQAGALVQAVDVTESQSIRDLVQRLDQEGKNLSIVLNNAGFGAMGAVADLDLALLKRQFDTNVIGPVALIQAVLPRLAKGSLIVNIGSISGDFVTPWAGAYCASKAALHALTEAMEMEMAPLGIHLMSVRPGSIQSAFSANAGSQSGVGMRANSPFAPYAAGLAARIGESQSGATTAQALAKSIVAACQNNRPPRVLRFGPKSRSLVLMKRLIPGFLLRRILAKRYGLLKP